MSRYRNLLLLVIALTGLWGCGTSPSSRFYTLSASDVSRQYPSLKGVDVAIDRITIPETVDRPQIVTTLDANRVSIDDFARWAAPLKGQISRALAEDFALAFPASSVSAYPERADDNAIRVVIDIREFESPKTGDVSLTAIWSIHRPGNGKVMNGRSVIREPLSGSGYEALVSAQSRALASLASEIATAIATAA
jgi:uncharacterized protein